MKKLSKKLSINKSTLSNLEKNFISGGVTASQTACSVNCNSGPIVCKDSIAKCDQVTYKGTPCNFTIVKGCGG